MRAALAALVLLAGCAQNGTGVELTVDPAGLAVDELEVVASYDGRTVPRTVEIGSVASLTLLAELPDEDTTVGFHVTGRFHKQPVGQGASAPIQVTAHRVVPATVSLAPGAGDGGLPDGETSDGGGALWHRQRGSSPPGAGSITAIWGSSAADLYATSTATGGVNLFHSTDDGMTWVGQLAGGSAVDLNGVSGSSATDVYLVGAGALVLHGSGTQWTAESAPVPSSTQLDAVWVVAPGDAYAVGGGNTVLHSASGSWIDQTAVGTTELHAVWGVPGQVWAVGSGGTILHSTENGAWSPETSNTSAELRGIFGTSASDLWVVGDGVVLHSTGNGAWTPSMNGVPAGVALQAVGGAPGGPVWAVGSGWTVLRRDGASWVAEPVDVPVDSASADLLRAIWAAPGGEAFAGGAGQTILHHP